jgi:hypothetical protein
MKQITLFCLSVVTAVAALSQKPRMAWSEEIKLKQGSFDQEVIQADKNGVFLKESHYAYKTFIVFATSIRESATLIRLDKNLMEVYRSNFNDDLKGKGFEDFFFLGKKLFVLASEYDKKDKSLRLFAAEVNKADGKRSGDFKQIAVWKKEEKNDHINFRVTHNADSSSMVLVSMMEGKEKNSYEISQFNDAMNQVGNTAILSNEFDPKMFQLEDVIYTKSGNVVLVGREYEYEERKKKKDKYLEFKNYHIRIYNSKGNQVKEINTDINGKWLISSKVKQMPNNEVILAAFYSNQKRGPETNGMLVQRIDPQTGNIISTNDKAINTALITAPEEDSEPVGDKNSKEKKPEQPTNLQDGEDGFSRYMQFRDFAYTSDGGVVVIAEEYNTYRYTTSSYNPGDRNSPGSRTTTTIQAYNCGNIMMSRMDAVGNISWLHVLPKQQIEEHSIGRESFGAGSGTPVSISFFLYGNSWPLYAGIGLLQTDNILHIIFNDHKLNADVLQLGQKVKRARLGSNVTNCYIVSLNIADGVYKRKFLSGNEDLPRVMPRLGSEFAKEFYMVGRQDKVFGKTKVVVGRLSIK